MQNSKKSMNFPQVVFSLIFVTIMIFSSLWIMRPFFLGFSWAGMVVIATWPIFLKLQILLWGSRFFAVILMILSLLLVFIVPIVCIVNSLIENSTAVISWLNSDEFSFPALEWLQNIPIIGIKLFSSYQKLLNEGGSELIAKFQPYMGRTTEFFVMQVGHCGRFVLHLIFMLIFSSLLYWNGEKVQNLIRYFAIKLGSESGDALVLLAGQAIRAVALGVVVTALVQGILSGIGLAISGIPYSSFLMVLIIIFCLVQLGPLPVLVPAIIWLYLNGNTTWGTVLLIWSCVVCILDHILRPILIRIGANLPTVIILSGVIGGLIAFGMIGLFIGPVILVISYRLIFSWMYNISDSNSLSKRSIQSFILKKKN